ncbi:BldC family transcriptional regulator [Streptomyces sp. Q6]|uniref:BldC family transcriptional regulator n=1 Tax=Streptomyces citrinus TaxID=3118173 RepID=A0ACD5AIV4_9ACTN
MTNRIPRQLLSGGEVAALLGVDPKTVTRWANLGKLPCFRTPGGHRRYRRADVERLTRSGDAS